MIGVGVGHDARLVGTGMERLSQPFDQANGQHVAGDAAAGLLLRLAQAISQGLDDAIVMLQSMAFSPYKKPFEDKLAKWDAQLNLVSGVVAF